MNSRLLESNTSQMIAYEKRLKDRDSRHKAEVAALEERVSHLQRENEVAETGRKDLISARKEIEELHRENAERDKQMKSLQEKYQKQKDEVSLYSHVSLQMRLVSTCVYTA
jgi:predicted RNase H-like nuclease (RuvC/YqgF family)